MKKAIYLLFMSLFPFTALASSSFGGGFLGAFAGVTLNEIMRPRQVYYVQHQQPVVYTQPQFITREIERPINIRMNEKNIKGQKLELKLIQEQNELLRQQNRQKKLALKQEELMLRKQELQLKAKMQNRL